MKNSPLQLERYYLNSVHLDIDDTVELKQMPEMQLESTVGLAGHEKDARRWKVTLTVNFKPVDTAIVPYKGIISFTGYFVVDPSYPEARVKFLVETNGPSVLFGAVRELCANLTARGPWQMLMLPTQSFYNPPTPAKTAEKKADAAT
jgi:preprotein translocase subunit SecB